MSARDELRRYDLYAALDGDMPYIEEREAEHGTWVSWSDVQRVLDAIEADKATLVTALEWQINPTCGCAECRHARAAVLKATGKPAFAALATDPNPAAPTPEASR